MNVYIIKYKKNKRWFYGVYSDVETMNKKIIEVLPVSNSIVIIPTKMNEMEDK